MTVMQFIEFAAKEVFLQISGNNDLQVMTNIAIICNS